MFTLQRASGRPLGEEIRRSILELIEEGTLKPGDKLPPERELATQYGVSLAPVRTALGALAAAGKLARVQGLGTFVPEPKVSINVGLFSSFTSVLNSAGVSFTMQVQRQDVGAAPEVFRDAAGASCPDSVVWLRRVAFVAGRPVAVLESWVDATKYGGLERVEGFEKGRSLFSTLRDEFDVRVKDQGGRLVVHPVDPDIEATLQLPPGGAAIVVLRMSSIDDGSIIEVSRTTYDPGVFSFELSPLPAHDTP